MNGFNSEKSVKWHIHIEFGIKKIKGEKKTKRMKLLSCGFMMVVKVDVGLNTKAYEPMKRIGQSWGCRFQYDDAPGISDVIKGVYVMRECL